MAVSTTLQNIAISYMKFARFDVPRLEEDMRIALSSEEQAFMPSIETVNKIVFCSEPNITPHISVYFTSSNSAEYCWDLHIRTRPGLDEDDEHIHQFFGSLTVMKTPDEALKKLPGKDSELS